MPNSGHVSVYTGPDRQERESYGRVWPTGLRGPSQPYTSYLGYSDPDYARQARARDRSAWTRYNNQYDHQRSGLRRSLQGDVHSAQEDDRRQVSRMYWLHTTSGVPRRQMPPHRDYDRLAPDYDLVRFMDFRESERQGHAVPGTRTLDFSHRPGGRANYRISDVDAENKEVGHFYRTPGCDWEEVNHIGTWGWR